MFNRTPIFPSNIWTFSFEEETTMEQTYLSALKPPNSAPLAIPTQNPIVNPYFIFEKQLGCWFDAYILPGTAGMIFGCFVQWLSLISKCAQDFSLCGLKQFDWFEFYLLCVRIDSYSKFQHDKCVSDECDTAVIRDMYFPLTVHRVS